MDNCTTYNDDQLWELIRAGNVNAFTEVYYRYWKLLFYVAADKLGDLYDAEDIVQEVFADLWKRRESVEISHSLKSFLAGATKFQVYKFLSRQQKLESPENTKWDIAEQHAAPDEIYRLKVLKHQLENAIQTLPERCKLVYELSRNEGLSHKEIGEVLEISTKTVENQITKAHKLLRASIEIFIIFLAFLFK